VNNINSAHERRTRELLEALDVAVEVRERVHSRLVSARTRAEHEALMDPHRQAVNAYRSALRDLTEHVTQQM